MLKAELPTWRRVSKSLPTARTRSRQQYVGAKRPSLASPLTWLALPQLQQILSMLPQSGPAATPSSLQTFVPPSDASSITPIAHIFNSSTTPPSVFSNASPAVAQQHSGVMFPGSTGEAAPRSPQNIASGRRTGEAMHTDDEPPAWPKLPGFAPPVGSIKHRYEAYWLKVSESPVRHVRYHPPVFGATISKPLASIVPCVQRQLDVIGCRCSIIVDGCAHSGASDACQRRRPSCRPCQRWCFK